MVHAYDVYMWCKYNIYICYIDLVDIHDRGKVQTGLGNKRRGGGGNNSEVIKQYLQAPAKT